MYISAYSTISHQPTFQQKGFSKILQPLAPNSVIIHPDYSKFIPKGKGRRMSNLLKMSISCAVDCLQQAGQQQPDAIIVGTSLGCNNFTRSFLDKILASKGNLISPTSFILSTHNTIAGQISLALGNTNYNITHTQNSLSFEHALINSQSCLMDGAKHILVGAADEKEERLYNMQERLDTLDLNLTNGANFFLLTSEPISETAVRIKDVKSYGLCDDLEGQTRDFLRYNDLSSESIDLVLFSSSQTKTREVIQRILPQTEIVDFQKYTGVYYTNSGFAMHLGVDRLLSEPGISSSGHILVCNNLIPENLGLILLEVNQG